MPEVQVIQQMLHQTLVEHCPLDQTNRRNDNKLVSITDCIQWNHRGSLCMHKEQW